MPSQVDAVYAVNFYYLDVVQSLIYRYLRRIENLFVGRPRPLIFGRFLLGFPRLPGWHVTGEKQFVFRLYYQFFDLAAANFLLNFSHVRSLLHSTINKIMPTDSWLKFFNSFYFVTGIKNLYLCRRKLLATASSIDEANDLRFARNILATHENKTVKITCICSFAFSELKNTLFAKKIKSIARTERIFTKNLSTSWNYSRTSIIQDWVNRPSELFDLPDWTEDSALSRPKLDNTGWEVSTLRDIVHGVYGYFVVWMHKSVEPSYVIVFIYQFDSCNFRDDASTRIKTSLELLIIQKSNTCF